MPSDRDLLFGKIALSQGFCTQAQVDECIQMQSLGETDAAVGELLLFKGYISSPQHAQVLEIQKHNLESRALSAETQTEAGLFGKLAVHEGLLSEDEVNECLREQAKEGEKRSLGEIMVAQGYLSEPQVRALLEKQQKRLMNCPACRLSFTVLSLSQGKEIHCPRCKAPLQETKPTGSTRTDAEFATRVVKTVKAGPPPGVRPAKPAIPPSGKLVTVICVICDAVFDGAIDATGRLRCPTCNSTFTPR